MIHTNLIIFAFIASVAVAAFTAFRFQTNRSTGQQTPLLNNALSPAGRS